MNRTGEYSFEDSRLRGGGDRGVATEQERRDIEKRRRAQQVEAAQQAEAAMQASVDAITGGPLSADTKRFAISRLQPSGLSALEVDIWREARTSVGLPPHV
jgi:hypothetical protein